MKLLNDWHYRSMISYDYKTKRSNSLQRATIEVRSSPVHGYGVFAIKPIAVGEIIEECPVLIVDTLDKELFNYWFLWKKDKIQNALALGYGGLYNHSKTPNTEWENDYSRNIITFKAMKNIAAGEEIFICYGKGWFKIHKTEEIHPISEKKDTLFLLGKILVIVLVIILVKWFL